MKDSDFERAIKLRDRRNKAAKFADEVYNYALSTVPEAYKFAFESLDQAEWTQVRDILVNACHKEAQKYADELDKL